MAHVGKSQVVDVLCVAAAQVVQCWNRVHIDADNGKEKAAKLTMSKQPSLRLGIAICPYTRRISQEKLTGHNLRYEHKCQSCYSLCRDRNATSQLQDTSWSGIHQHCYGVQ